MKWFNWKILATALLLGLGWWILKPSGAKAKAGPAPSDAITVAAVKVDREDISRQQVFEAEFRPYEEVELHAKVTGFVDAILVDVGDQVTNGQLLATLEIPELQDELDHALAVEKRNQKEVKKSEAEHEEAHLAYSRLAAVDKAKPHLVAQQDLDLAMAKDRSDEAALDTAKQQIEVSKAEAKKLQTMLKYSRITAPFSGVITRRFTDPGALVQGGGSSSSPMLRLSQNDRLRLVFPVSDSFVPLIKRGDPLEIRVQSLGRTFGGAVARFTRKIETATRTMEVEAEVPNPDLTLVPGMYASVALIVEHREKTLVIPVEAVSRQAANTILAIDKQQRIEERAIKLGLETASKVEVLTGLNEGDLVLIGSRSQLRPGQRVEPKIIGQGLNE